VTERVTAAAEAEIGDAVREAAARGHSFEIVSRGTKRDFGRPVAADAVLDVSAISGILKYEPEELVLTVRAATPLAEIDAALAGKRQILPFEPADWGPLFGTGAGSATLAGIAAVNACGPRRVKSGAVRDSVIGCRFVNGSGEAIKAGGRVIKNVTGFDLPKLMCGAFGTLGVLTELTVRVSPAPERVAALVIRDCSAEAGLRALRQAAGLAVDPTGLAYLPAEALTRIAAFDAGESDAVLIRVEGTTAAIGEKLTVLRGRFADHDTATLQDDRTAALFRDIGNGGVFAGYDGDIWRLCVPASDAYAAAEAAGAPLWYADWAGGLLWLGLAASEDAAARLRRITTRFGGHATLMRATSEARSRLAVFEPETPDRAALTRAVKAAFDPSRVLNPGRMFEGT
jgi:glycolate oxidase FAD binding subunit